MKNIVVGLDGSSRASLVLDSAVAVAKAFGGKLTLLRVVKVPVELPMEPSIGWAKLEQEMETAAMADLKKQTAAIPPDLVADTLVRIATPWDGICRTAEKLGADCIVIGSHGYGIVDRLLGTTAAKVVNHAPCSVMVVRMPLA